MEKGKEVINEPFWTHPDGGKEIIMNTYITKQQAIDAFDSPDVDWYYGDVDPDSVIRVIEQIPAADVQPVKRSEWTEAIVSAPNLYDSLGMMASMHGYVCSCCQDFSVARYNFCPNCGADMRGNNE